MPHMPYEKSKMIDITRDKPIKIAVRVAVPVRDHPKFNFVGKLLGRMSNFHRKFSGLLNQISLLCSFFFISFENIWGGTSIQAQKAIH
jgi:hypothetical protein